LNVRGGIVSQFHGVDSEVGPLRTVLLHRPGAELKRITPRNGDKLLFAGVPWADRARHEHDIFAQGLRDHGVEVLYLTQLLQDALEYQPARHQAVASVLADVRLGDELRGQLQHHLDGLDPEELTQVLVAGLTAGEFRRGRGAVYHLLDACDFVIDPLPNLVFTRDSSVWIGDRVAIASPAAPGRRREAELVSVIYTHHPMFAGTKPLYKPQQEPLDGGDLLLLAPGVIAVGISDRTRPAAVERLSRSVFDSGLAHTVLGVPIDRQRGMPGHVSTVHLDTVCTMVDADAVVMCPAVAYSLTARVITPRSEGLRVSHPQPFLEAAAQAMGIERLRLIDTGLDPVSAAREQWDDASNALAIGPGLAVSHERNVETNARLEAAGIEVIRVPGSELRSRRGGPRCMSCAIARDPASMPDSVVPEARRQVVPEARRQAESTAVSAAVPGARSAIFTAVPAASPDALSTVSTPVPSVSTAVSSPS
jgi:arginine deiminase